VLVQATPPSLWSFVYIILLYKTLLDYDLCESGIWTFDEYNLMRSDSRLPAARVCAVLTRRLRSPPEKHPITLASETPEPTFCLIVQVSRPPFYGIGTPELARDQPALTHSL